MPSLHTHLFGPVEGPPILAVHGLTGHGRRFGWWSEEEVPHARVIAPDLLGHGRSSWTAPWGIEAQVDALEATLREHAAGSPALVIGHSYGGLLAVHLAARAPELIKALLLLDPAIGAEKDVMTENAVSSVDHHDYADRAEAIADKKAGGWADVPEAALQADVDEHLVALPDGRVSWRLSPAAVITSWSELARPPVLAPTGISTTVIVADKTQPPLFSPVYEKELAEHLDGLLTVLHLDIHHMVLEERPDVVGKFARALL